MTIIPADAIQAQAAPAAPAPVAGPPPTDLTTPPAGPLPGAPPGTPPETEAIPPEGEAGPVPEHLLENPIVQLVLIGKPGAVSTKRIDEPEEVRQVFAEHKPLLDLGITFYRSIKGRPYVIFNPFHVHPETIVEADKTGKLDVIAPDWATKLREEYLKMLRPEVREQYLNQLKEQAGTPAAEPEEIKKKETEKAEKEAKEEAGSAAPPPLPKTPTLPTTDQLPSTPVSVRRRIAQARVAALPKGGPASGPRPGGGRLLNLINSPLI